MLNAIDEGGIRRLAATFLLHDRPADRAAAMATLTQRLGVYDREGLCLAAAVDGYFADGARR